MSHILTIESLTKSFGKVMAVENLSLQVNHGEILGIIGPNGAGKTTLFNLITGEIRPDRGKVVFNGTDVTFAQTYKRCRMGIARTYQIPRPFLNMSVLENILVGGVYGAAMSYGQSKQKCEEILEKTGLLSKRDFLAKALSTCPTLILIDEVAGGLTESEVEEVLETIKSARKDGITVLWVEHIMMARQKGPDRLLVMDFGQELFYGTPEEALESKKVQEVYLGTEEN